MGRRPKPIPEGHINLAEVERRLGVSKSQVYALRKQGVLEIFKDGHAPLDAFLDLPLLATSDLRARGITEEVLAQAARSRVFTRRALYSLNDVEALRKHREVVRRAGEVDERLRVSLSGHICAAGDYDFKSLLDEYRRDGLQPEDLPLWFWDRDTCPAFEPPTDFFQYLAGETIGNRGGETRVMRSAGYSRRTDGTIKRELDGLHHDGRPGRSGNSVPGLFDEGTPLPQYAEENAAYDDAEMRWATCFRRAQRKLR